MNQLSKHQKDISSITAKLIKVLFVLLAILSIASFIKVHSLFSSSPKSKETPSSSVPQQVDQFKKTVPDKEEKLLEELSAESESEMNMSKALEAFESC